MSMDCGRGSYDDMEGVKTTDSIKTTKNTVINIIGGPGVGKSTFCALTYALMKQRGESVELVTEYAKKLVWMERFEELDNQYQVTVKQFNSIDSVYRKVKYVITDGSVLHGLYYNRSNKNNVCDKEKTEQKIMECYSKHNNLNILLTRGAFAYEQAGRYQTEMEAIQVDYELEAILLEKAIPFTKVMPGDRALDDILKIIYEQ